MPVYVYECPQCKRIQELVQKFSERIFPLCFCSVSELDGIEMKPAIVSSTFILKGKCWAKDGYK